MNITLYRNPDRAMAAWSPFYRPLTLLEEMEELARDFWGAWQPGREGMALMPRTDVYEEKGELVVKTELPGIAEQDLEITLEGGSLIIKAEKKEEVTEEATHHTRERRYGSYVRSMSLPFPVDGDKVTATFAQGVLELRLPVAAEAKPKKIEVRAPVARGEGKARRRKRQKPAES